MTKNIQDNKLASGILFIEAIDFLKSKKGNRILEDLEKSYGEILFDQHRMYPLEKLIELQKEVINLVFGKETDSEYKELGKYTFESFVHSMVGATLTNIVPSPKVLLGKIQELWGVVINFGERKLTLIDERGCRAIIEINDDPRMPAYIQGVIEAGFNYIKVKNPKTKIIKETGNGYTIEINWQM
jgi:uncharacterized protein (TIGR02265 family)